LARDLIGFAFDGALGLLRRALGHHVAHRIHLRVRQGAELHQLAGELPSEGRPGRLCEKLGNARVLRIEGGARLGQLVGLALGGLVPGIPAVLFAVLDLRWSTLTRSRPRTAAAAPDTSSAASSIAASSGPI
jgi:hypothetical protein